MSTPIQQHIDTWLKEQDLAPERQNTDKGTTGWRFTLAEHLQAELFCYESTEEDVTAVLLASVQLKPGDNPTTLAAAIAPALAPLSIMVVEDALSLRLLLQGKVGHVAALLEEGIVLTRHVLFSVGSRIVELAEGKIPMQNAMVQALQALHGNEGRAPRKAEPTVSTKGPLQAGS
ncbi:MAG: hypothetical protein OXC07_10465 [Kistimonas sp.]|nr:hypothetical protein [Kistimonas sp.]